MDSSKLRRCNRKRSIRPWPAATLSLPRRRARARRLRSYCPFWKSSARSRKAEGIAALVLSPTRELAIQIHETFANMAAGTGIRAAVVVGGLSEHAQLQAIRKGAAVLIATPGRLCDFLDRKLVNLGSVRILVLDEADRMLDMGFLPSIRRIMAATPTQRQTLFFSATIESSVRHLVDAHVKNAVRVPWGLRPNPPSRSTFTFTKSEQDQKVGLLRLMLAEEPGSFLVFARTKHGADRLARKLAREGFKAAAIHGDRSQNQRNQALSGFQEGYYRVLVATDVAARGIHVEGIAQVVNFDLPQVPRISFTASGARAAQALAELPRHSLRARREARIAHIERALGIRLERREVSVEIPREQKRVAPVIVMPEAARPQVSRAAPRPLSRRSVRFTAGPQRRRVRPAV